MPFLAWYVELSVYFRSVVEKADIDFSSHSIDWNLRSRGLISAIVRICSSHFSSFFFGPRAPCTNFPDIIFGWPLNSRLFQARPTTSPTSAWSSTLRGRPASPSSRRAGSTPGCPTRTPRRAGSPGSTTPSPAWTGTKKAFRECQTGPKTYH